MNANRFGIFCVLIAAGLFLSGSISIVRGLASQQSVAHTKNLGDIPKPLQSQAPGGRYMEHAVPTHILIPSINVDSPLITVSKTPDGAIDTPKGDDFDKAAWYQDSPAPGQYGASVIVGHVDSYASGNGASVFFNLAKLKPGDTVQVARSDNTTALFEIYATRQFDRDNMPDDQIYTPNAANAELRLITCAGTFDSTTQKYSSNTVIFARLTDS